MVLFHEQETGSKTQSKEESTIRKVKSQLVNHCGLPHFSHIATGGRGAGLTLFWVVSSMACEKPNCEIVGVFSQ